VQPKALGNTVTFIMPIGIKQYGIQMLSGLQGTLKIFYNGILGVIMRRENRWYDSWWLEDLAVRISNTKKLTRQGSWYIEWQPWVPNMFPGTYADIFLKKSVRKHAMDGKWEIL